MKKAILFGALGALVLSSCSLLERHEDLGDPTAETVATEATGVSDGAPSMESEVSRLNTKISALETKLDVLTANMERIEMQRSQPIIEAQPAPQPTMAAPVEVPESTQVSAAPVQPSASLPSALKSADAGDSSGAEKEFRAAMVLFQNGKNMDAAARFALLAKKFPQHLLASHSLYWAGEASARGQQWSLATENWEELEQRYPRSAYVPEALAGLARAYNNQGDTGKAKTYRELLLKAFPKSPVTLSMHAPEAAPVSTKRVLMKPEPSADGDGAPVYKEESSETGGE